MKTLTHCSVRFEIKAVAEAASGERTFEGLAATWDKDLGGDIIHKGAFKEWLAGWKKSDEALPLLNSHDHWNILSALGQLTEAKETDQGLWTKWEVLDGPDGDGLLARLRPSKTTKRPIVGKMSIGFIPEEFNFEQPKGTTDFWDRIRHITKADLVEVSVVLFPMQPGASIDASTVKAMIVAAKATDAKTLTVDTKVQLRALAQRIGLLLKTTKDATPPKDEASDDDLADPAEAPPASPPNPAPPAIVADDASDAPPAADDSGSTGDPPAAKAVPEPYPYADALRQRLQATLLRNRVSAIRPSP